MAGNLAERHASHVNSGQHNNLMDGSAEAGWEWCTDSLTAARNAKRATLAAQGVERSPPEPASKATTCNNPCLVQVSTTQTTHLERVNEDEIGTETQAQKNWVVLLQFRQSSSLQDMAA
jgi:hypothetical protein